MADQKSTTEIPFPADAAKPPVATLTFKVDYDHLPDSAEVAELMTKAKEKGTPRDATLVVHRRTVITPTI